MDDATDPSNDEEVRQRLMAETLVLASDVHDRAEAAQVLRDMESSRVW